MKIIELDKIQFDLFAKKHKYRNYFQTSNYGDVMDMFNYDVKYIGIENDNDTIIGASLLLLQEGAMKTKLAYAPRGILFDFTNSDNVMELVETMKKDLGKMGIVSLRMDPAMPLNIRNSKGQVINVNNEAGVITDNLKAAGFTYKGETLYFETEKPRWEALTVLENDIREIYKNFDSQTRIKINKALKSGIEIYKDPNKDISQLYEFIKQSGQPIKYYKGLVDKFKENAEVYYAKLNTEKFLIYSKEVYEQELANNEKLAYDFQVLATQHHQDDELFKKKTLSDKVLDIYKSNMIFATNILKDYPEGLIISGALNIIYDNAAYVIAEGSNQKFKNLNASYLLRWGMVKDYNEKKLKYINLGAVTGNFEKNSKFYGLNKMKCGYNAVVTEYIGEYDIILNGLKYGLYNTFTKDK